MSKRNLLVTLIDKDYTDQAKQLFSSVYFNAGWDGDYMLLAHEIPESELKWFKDRDILVYDCKKIPNSDYSGKGTSVCFNKFYIFTPEFRNWDKILYLDIDIIVKNNLEELFLTENFTAIEEAVSCLENFNLKKPESEIQKKLHKEAFTLTSQSTIFNAGVFSISTKIIHENTFDKLISLMNTFNPINNASDQLILNIYFSKITIVNNSYNFLINLLPLKEIIKIKNPTVLHFAGINKPWNIKNFFYSEWKNNLDNSEKIISFTKKEKKRIKFNFFSNNFLFIKIMFYVVYVWVDRAIGRFGLILKKYFNPLYTYLKK